MMNNEDRTRNINIGSGNYNERIEGNYYENNYIQINTIPKPTGFPQNIPRSNTDKFVGRQEELIRLHQQLQDENKVTIAHLEGMGGIGKTELAIVYSLINLQDNSYPGGICWLFCREEDIGLQIVNFVRKFLDLKPPEDLELVDRVAWCWQYWREGNALIVLDDVTDYGKIKHYLPPQSSKFKILITTRLKLDLSSPLYLEVLSESEALDLLSGLIGSEKVQQELATAKIICQRLGYLPLALQLVGKYIKNYRISLSEELQLLEEERLNNPSLRVSQNNPTWTSNINHGVAAAFELSWKELSKSAQELACLMSLFALAPIPWLLIENITLKEPNKATSPRFKFLQIFSLFKKRNISKKDSKTLKDARVELENVNLVKTEDNYQLHQLIQEFFRIKQNNLANAEEQKRNFCAAIAEIANQIPKDLTLEDVNYFSPFIPHIAKTANFYQNWLSDEDLTKPFISLGIFYQGQGLYEQALPWYEQSLSVVKECFGEEHPDAIQSLAWLGSFYNDQRKYEESESFYLKALELAKKLLGEEHIQVANSLNNLALLYLYQGRNEKAEPLCLQALNLYKKLLGESHPDVATSLHNLAFLYTNQGKYEQAEALYLQALELRKQILGEEHPLVANSLHSLAFLYDNQGKYEQAEALYLQALELRKQLLGESHPDVATSINNLASIYDNQERYEEAETLYLQALEWRKQLLGESHFDVANILNNLALLYTHQGRYEEAETLYLQALELGKQLLGEKHPQVTNSLHNLAFLYHNQGRYEEAETLYLQALELRQQLLGESHPDVATSINNLAGLYDNQGRYEEAVALYKQALKIAEATLGTNHPNTNVMRGNLQYTLNKMQD